MWYIFFMTFIGVILTLATGNWLWTAGFFVLSLLPAGLVLTAVFVGWILLIFL